MPDSLDRVLDRARQLQIPDDQIYDRMGQAIEQLRQMVIGNSRDAERYQNLVQRIAGLSSDLMSQLCRAASAAGNLEAMAALMAIDMGAAANQLPADQAGSALGYKGIGGGRNLLVQWFNHRGRVPKVIRKQIKAMVKAALMDEAFDWMGKGEGSGERGLVPQNRARPFRAGDGLDALDIEATLDAIVGSGKGVDQVTEEDLFASERVKGKAAMSVLVDISGSMGGGELAACAIAIVMLLGRLLPSEVALAAFESNTHVIKDFADDVDLDHVADQVLELAATGGTRVEAALRWCTGQLQDMPEADLRVLFLLSDFAFFEDEKALRAPLRRAGRARRAPARRVARLRVEGHAAAVPRDHRRRAPQARLPAEAAGADGRRPREPQGVRAAMAENKTKPTGASVADYLAALPAKRRADCDALVAMMTAATGEAPAMWGPSIVGFGRYHYRYDSGREGDFLRVGFAPRKANLVPVHRARLRAVRRFAGAPWQAQEGQLVPVHQQARRCRSRRPQRARRGCRRAHECGLPARACDWLIRSHVPQGLFWGVSPRGPSQVQKCAAWPVVRC